MSAQSALYVGSVRHQRLRPVRHRLSYRVYSLLLDVDELPSLSHRLRLFSLNRFNLFSLHERDYGAGDGQTLRGYVDQLLLAAGLQPGGAVQLLSMPRILGYAFNPLSVYFCHRPEGGLQAVIYEVHNTFGERHSYLVEVAASERDAPAIAQRCEKTFHVSPFLGLSMQYDFRVVVPRPDQPRMRIDIKASDSDGAVLVASFDAHRRTLGDAALALTLFSHPLLTLKVIAGIYWEALRLWVKRVPLHQHPVAPVPSVTITRVEHS
ncbi:MAG: DUF1365 domain-containing protein [Caldimonas sp.]